MPRGGAGEGRRHRLRVGLALDRAEGGADEVGREVGRDPAQIGRGQDLDRQALRPLDRGLALEDAQLRARPRPPQPARQRDLEVGAKLGLQPGPQADRGDHQRDGRREAAGPGLALLEERLERDLGVDAAGVGAGRLRVELAALDQQHVGAAAGEIVGDGGAGEPAADHQDVGAHQAAARRFRFAGTAAPTYRPGRARRGDPAGHGTAVPRQLHGHDHTLHRGRQGDRPRGLAPVRRLAAGRGRARHHHPRHHGRVPDHHRRRAPRVRRGDGQARRRAHPGHGRHDERLHAQRRALQPRGGGAGCRRADDRAALLLHADRGRDLRLLQGDLRGGLDPDHALQQPVHLQRRHVGEAGRAADPRLRADPLHQGGEPGHRAGLRHHRGDRGRDERVRRRADRRNPISWVRSAT